MDELNVENFEKISPKRKFPLWGKVLIVFISLTAVLSFVVFGDYLIGGQGLMKRDMKSLKIDGPIRITPQIVQVEPYYYGAEIVTAQVAVNTNIDNAGKDVVLYFELKNLLENESINLNTAQFQIQATGACANVTKCFENIYLATPSKMYGGNLSSSGLLKFDSVMVEIPSNEFLKFALVTNLYNLKAIANSTFQFSLMSSDLLVLDSTRNKVNVAGSVIGSLYTIVFPNSSAVGGNSLTSQVGSPFRITPQIR